MVSLAGKWPLEALREVLLAPKAEQDLRDIYACMIDHAGQKQADTILSKLEQTILSLENLSLRGNIPPELEAVGIVCYRALHENPWHIIANRWRRRRMPT